MTRASWLRKFARLATRALRMIAEELEQRIEKLILEGCPYPVDKIAEFVTISIISWVFREDDKVVVSTTGRVLQR